MTLATKITILRIFLVPVFSYFAIAYGLSISSSSPDESLRWIALSVFSVAATSDWLDGWIARHYNQHSELGAFLDPIADKALVFSAIIILTIFHWGNHGWAIPIWFAALVILRDCVILGGIRFLYSKDRKVAIKPHWTGKACTFSLFLVIGWTMLKAVEISPAYPCAFATLFLVWSLFAYIRQGLPILNS